MLSDVKRISEVLIEKRFRLSDAEYGSVIVIGELVKKMIMWGYVPNRLDIKFADYKNCGISYGKVTKEAVENLLKGTNIKLLSFRNEYSFSSFDNELTIIIDKERD